MNRCEQEKRLTPYLLGDLSEREEADFSRHLAECTACQECARELSPVLQSLADGLAKDGGTVPKFDLHHQLRILSVQPESTHRVLDWMSRSRPWLVAAASALVVTGLSYYLLFSSMSRQYGWGVVRAAKYSRPGGWATMANAQIVASEPNALESAKSAAPLEQLVGGTVNGTVWSLADADGDGSSDSFFGKDQRASVALPQLETPAEASDLLLQSRGLEIESASGSGVGTPDQAMDFATLEGKTRLVESASSRLVMKGLYAGRTAGGRMRALKEYGKEEDEKFATDKAYARADEFKSPAKEQHYRAVRMVTKAIEPQNKVLFDYANIYGGTIPMVDAYSVPLAVTDNRATLELPAAKKTDASTAENQPRRPTYGCAASDGAKGMSTAGLVSEEQAAQPSHPRRVAQVFNPFVDTAENHFSTFAIDVSTASYNLTRRAIRAGALPDPDTVRTEEILNAFDYGDAAPDRTTFRVYVEGAPSAFGAPGLTMLRIGVKGKRLGREEQRPAMLTFLIDTSGSMAEPDRIGRARTALRLLLDQLAPADKIQLIAFDDKARVVLFPTAASQKDAILKAFDTLQCNGSTNLEDGMHRAYEQAAKAFVPGGENRVVLISDGVANLGADNAQDILRQVEAFRKQGVTCSVFGVGEGTYNDAMLVDLANKGQGVYRFLDSDEEVKRVFVDDLAATLNNIATDVKIQVEWSAETVRRFRQLGYERRALKTEQFRDDTVEAGEVGSGQSVTALYELDLAPDVRHALLGTVRVRYRRVDNGLIEEIAQEITPAMIAPTLHATRPQLRLAVGAAAFAELLRGSPHMVRAYTDVTKLLRPVAQEISIDPRVKELLTLAESAEGLSK